VHSGDATIVYPSQRLYVQTAHEIQEIAAKLSRALKITGPFNIQFLVKHNKVYVIEINLRASRSFPFTSKATGINFAEKAVAAFFGKSKPEKLSYPNYVVVKSPQFSFSRLTGADPVLRVEMASTGEVACFGRDFPEALLKSVYAGAAFNGKKAVLLSLGGEINKAKLLESARKLAFLGYKLYATNTTHSFLESRGIEANLVYKVYEGRHPNVTDLISQKKVSFVVNLSERSEQPEKHFHQHVTDGYLIRRATVDGNVPLFTDLELARAFVTALANNSAQSLEIVSWSEYLNKPLSKEN